MKIDTRGSGEIDYYDFLSSPDSWPTFYRDYSSVLDNECLLVSGGPSRILVTAGNNRQQFLARLHRNIVSPENESFIDVAPTFGNTTFVGYDRETTELMFKKIPRDYYTPSIDSPLIVAVIFESGFKKYVNPILKNTFLSYVIPASWIYNSISDYIKKEESK